MKIVVCEWCNKTVHRKERSDAKYRFCSVSCAAKWRIRETNKTWNRSGSNNPAWKGGIRMAQGYVFLIRPNHPRANNKGYVQEHRLIMEEHLGRYLTEKERVHHINGIKNDNRIDNLQLLRGQGDHIKIHMKNGSMDNRYWKGKKRSLETKMKMSKAHKELWKNRKSPA